MATCALLWLCTFGLILLDYKVASSKDDLYEFCTQLTDPEKSLPSIQGVSAFNGTLYLMMSFNLYGLPLKPEYIDNTTNTIALYQKDSEFKNFGPWTKLSWITKHFPPTTGLKYFTIFINPYVDVENQFRVMVHLDDGGTNVMILNKTGQILPDWVNSTANYGLVGDGTTERAYLFRTGSQGMIYMDPQAVKMRQTSRIYFPDILTRALSSQQTGIYYPELLQIQGQNQTLIAFNLNPSGGPALVVSFPIYGFIYSGTVHLWDLSTRTVILFPDPGLDGKYQQANPVLTRVSFDDYFQCTNPGLLAPVGWIVCAVLGSVLVLTCLCMYCPGQDMQKNVRRSVSSMIGFKRPRRRARRTRAISSTASSSISSSTSERKPKNQRTRRG